MSKEVMITAPTTPVQQGLFRKRSSRPVHIKSWTIMLNKNGFVRCHLQHCRYIAYCIDDMREHFKTCRGEVAGNFVCPTCGGQTTSQEALDYHKRNNHKDSDVMSIIIKPTLTEIQLTLWSTDIKTRGYTQCLMPDCHFISYKISELEQHYEKCLGEDPDTSSKFLCRHCKGYTSSQQALQFHQNNHHKDLLFPIKQESRDDFDEDNKIKSYPMGQYGHPTASTTNPASKIVTYSQWKMQEDLADTESICSEVNVNSPTDAQIKEWIIGLKNGYVHCNHNSCKYMSFDVDDMNDHFATCFEPYLDDEFECSICGGKTTSSNKLKTHLLHHHEEGYKHLTEEECGFKLVETEDGLELQSENKEPKKRKTEEVDDEYEEKHSVKRKSYDIPYNHLTKWRDELLRNKFIRCTAADCSYLALDMLEMKQHSDEHVDSVYWSFKDRNLEDRVANYCDACNGHFKTIKHLDGHKLVSHNSSDTSNIDSLLVDNNEENIEDDEEIEEIF